MQKMKENREGYERLADRAVRLLAAVANTITKASPEKMKGMEGNVLRLLMCVMNAFDLTRRPDAPVKHASEDPVGYGDTPQILIWLHRKADEACARQRQERCARVSGSRRTKGTRGRARPRGGRVRRMHSAPSTPSHCAHIICQVTSSIRVEIVLEDVRALAMSLTKRLEEINNNISRDAMNGV
jgi:hypothetical protein